MHRRCCQWLKRSRKKPTRHNTVTSITLSPPSLSLCRPLNGHRRGHASGLHLSRRSSSKTGKAEQARSLSGRNQSLGRAGLAQICARSRNCRRAWGILRRCSDSRCIFCQRSRSFRIPSGAGGCKCWRRWTCRADVHCWRRWTCRAYGHARHMPMPGDTGHMYISHCHQLDSTR